MSARRDVSADEMYDSAEDLAEAGCLGTFLRLCKEKLIRPYEEADTAAIASQTAYRRLIRLASIFATAALALATWNLNRGSDPSRIAELVVAVATIVLVAVGLAAHLQKRWLLNRYKAERYRLLKFQSLVQPAMWGCAPEHDWAAGVERNRARIADLEDVDLETEASREEIPRFFDPQACAGVEPKELSRLLAYYVRKRVRLQAEYFRRAARQERSVLLNPLWLPLIFFVSMILAAAQLVIELWPGGPRLSTVGLIEAFSLLSLMIPAVWAGLRLQLTANEVGRNRNRSLAKYDAIGAVGRRLAEIHPGVLLQLTETVEATRDPEVFTVREKREGPPDPGLVFTYLALSEYMLSADQHEWLRLMLEAEWYR